MEKSNVERVFDFVKEFPTATNSEIEKALELSEHFAKSYIGKLKNRGFIETFLNDDGLREVTILEEFRNRSLINKNISSKNYEYIKEMIDILMDDFRLADIVEKRIELGKEIRLMMKE